jgi:hypothetical protein
VGSSSDRQTFLRELNVAGAASVKSYHHGQEHQSVSSSIRGRCEEDEYLSSLLQTICRLLPAFSRFGECRADTCASGSCWLCGYETTSVRQAFIVGAAQDHPIQFSLVDHATGKTVMTASPPGAKVAHWDGRVFWTADFSAWQKPRHYESLCDLLHLLK